MSTPSDGSPEEWFSWLVGSDSELRKRATLILGGLEPTDDVPVAALQERLDDPREDVVFWAVVALKRLGPRASAASSAIAAIVATHPAFGVRQAAVAALPSVAATEPGMTSILRGALRDASPFVRREALQALIAMPQLEPADLEAVAGMADDQDENVSRWSEIALRNLRLRTD